MFFLIWKIAKKFHFSKAPPFDFSSIPGRSDSRLGRRGKKLGDCGIVGLWDCGEIAISEISGFFMFFLIWKIAKFSLFKGPPLWFCAGNPDFLISGAKPKGEPLKSWFFAFFQIRKNMKNREISEIAISPQSQSHNPRVFSPAPQPRIWAAAAWSEMIDRHE